MGGRREIWRSTARAPSPAARDQPFSQTRRARWQTFLAQPYCPGGGPFAIGSRAFRSVGSLLGFRGLGGLRGSACLRVDGPCLGIGRASGDWSHLLLARLRRSDHDGRLPRTSRPAREGAPRAGVRGEPAGPGQALRRRDRDRGRLPRPSLRVPVADRRLAVQQQEVLLPAGAGEQRPLQPDVDPVVGRVPPAGDRLCAGGSRGGGSHHRRAVPAGSLRERLRGSLSAGLVRGWAHGVQPRGLQRGGRQVVS